MTHKQRKIGQLVLSGALALAGYLLKLSIGYELVTIALLLAATVIAGVPIIWKAVGALRYRVIGIELLVSIAIVGAAIIGEYWEGAAVSFLFMLGDFLEARTLEKTRSSIRELMALAPDVARVRRAEGDVEVSPDDVQEGDLVVVKPGEKIAVDGTVLEGSAWVNQATTTGESTPVYREEGGEVYSGTILESGWLLIRADLVGEDTSFARILEMVEEAQDKKTKTQKFIEKFSAKYTPAIILLAIVVYFITRDVHLVLTLLVISCPGALVIGTPVSMVAGIGNGAKHGVLAKGGDIMEKLGKVQVIAFDKTGTLTVGKPGVTRVRAVGGGVGAGAGVGVDGSSVGAGLGSGVALREFLSEDDVLRIAAIGEAYSEHPLGKAIIDEAVARFGGSDFGAADQTPEDVEILTARGLAFTWEGKRYYVGNRRLLDEVGIDYRSEENYLSEEEDKGQTAVMLADEERLLGILSIADKVRPEASALVADLKKKGVRKVVMLTGDNKRSAQAVARQIGVDEVYSELLPEDKVRILKNLSEEGYRVAMVGDGVNDAPALASADLGIAIGGQGKDVAMETADVVLLGEDISRLSYAVGLSRATVRNMRQNIVLALAVVLLLLMGVLFNLVDMTIGMLVHELSVLVVILNGMRLMYYKG